MRRIVFAFFFPFFPSSPSAYSGAGCGCCASAASRTAFSAAAGDAAARQAAAEVAARAAAEKAAREAAEAAAAAAGPQYAEGEEWEEWEEESEYEYAAYKHGRDEAHVEPAVLVQPLNGEVGEGEEAGTLGSAVPLCKAGSEAPCASPVRGGEGTCKSCRRRRRYTKAQIEQFEHEKCQTVGVGMAIAGFFVPEAKLAKAIAAGIGVGTALSC